MKTLHLFLLFFISLPSIGQPNKELIESNKQYPDSATVLFKIGKSYLFSQADSASKYFKKALISSEREQDFLVKANILKSIGILNMVKSNYDSAIYYYNLSGNVYQQINHKEGYADVLTNKGFAYSKLARYTEALKYTHKGLDIYDSLHLLKKTSNTYTNLGIIFQLNNDFEKALFNYQKAIDTAPDYKKNVKRSLVNIATIYNKQHKYDSALSIYTMAQVAMEKENDIYGLSIIHNNIGDVYYSLQQYPKAADQFRKAIAYKEQINNKQGQAIAYKNLAEVLMKMGNTKEANTWVIKSLELSKEVNSKKQILDALLLSAQINKEVGSHDTANKFYSDYIFLKDSLDNAEQIKAIEEIQEKYQSEHQQKEIAQLETQNKQSQLEMEKGNNQRNILLFVIVLILVFAIFLTYSILNNKKSQRILAQKNELIQLALGDKETLLKEIHHRVKNNLQIISSLLSLQTRYISDKKAIQAVNEGKNRVKSMALIHQKDNLTGIEMDDYIQNLVESLFASYGISDGKIKFTTDIAPIRLDVDTAIPLGLILNELVSNALKHAFNNDGGELLIELKEKNKKLHFKIKDNGKGISEKDKDKKEGFGLRLIDSLARKLKATVSLDSTHGTCYNVEVEKYKIV